MRLVVLRFADAHGLLGLPYAAQSRVRVEGGGAVFILGDSCQLVVEIQS